MDNNKNDKPVVLKAIDLILAKPEDIHKEAQTLLDEYKKAHPGKADSELQIWPRKK